MLAIRWLALTWAGTYLGEIATRPRQWVGGTNLTCPGMPRRRQRLPQLVGGTKQDRGWHQMRSDGGWRFMDPAPSESRSFAPNARSIPRPAPHQAVWV